MKEWIVILLLAGCLLICLAVLAVREVYFLRQWKRMDRILDGFWGDAEETDGEQASCQEETGGGNDVFCQEKEEHRNGVFIRNKLTGGNTDFRREERKGRYAVLYSDTLETRESRIISQLQRILADARYKQRQAVGEKDQVMELISDLSHQLKTPLANIIMNTELLQDSSLDQERREEFLAHTRDQAYKMKWLMADLLKASRLENGMICFEAGYTGIKGTIAKAVGSVYAQASAKGIELIMEEFQDVRLYHNPKWTAEAMANILENAVKYSPENSSIKIILERLEIYTKITVSDEGIGIPKSEFNLIFQRFYRGKEVEQQEGSGLGLYLAQLILRCEKGYVTAASDPGAGSRFSVFLLNETG